MEQLATHQTRMEVTLAMISELMNCFDTNQKFTLLFLASTISMMMTKISMMQVTSTMMLVPKKSL